MQLQKYGFYSSNAALTPEPQLSPTQVRKIHLHLTVLSVPKAYPCCLTQTNQSQGTSGPDEAVLSQYFIITRQKRLFRTSSYNLYAQEPVNSLQG